MSRHLLAGVIGITFALPAYSETAPMAVAFHEGAIEAPLSDAPGDATAGATVMTTAALGNCVACHQIGTMPDIQFQGNIAPPLDGAADRYTEAQLRGIVANAKMTFTDSFMPAFYKTSGFIRPGDAYTGKAGVEPLAPILTAQQIEDVVAYLLTLKE